MPPYTALMVRLVSMKSSPAAPHKMPANWGSIGYMLSLPIGVPLPSPPVTVIWMETPASTLAASPQVTEHGEKGGGGYTQITPPLLVGLALPTPQATLARVEGRRPHRRHRHWYRRTGGGGGGDGGRDINAGAHSILYLGVGGLRRFVFRQESALPYE